MKLVLLQVPGCPGADLVAARLAELGIEDVPRRVTDELRTGSPTLLIDGVDPFAEPAPPGLACRLYRDERGIPGRAPSLARLRTVLEAAMNKTAARLAWTTLKLTNAGENPVPVERLAQSVGIEPAEARGLAERIGFAVGDDAVSMVFPAGGSRRHLMQVGDRTLDTGRGCSVDAYLLAIATGEQVHVESACPATGTPIRLDLTADAVLDVEPPDAVVSVLTFRDVDLAEGFDKVDAEICIHQRFFASAEAAAGWLAEHPDGRIHPVSDYLEHARHLVAALEA
jgi:alkylmercury lyase